MGEAEQQPYDSAIVGAGPGGLQAAIYLARYNFRVVLLDRSGGRTRMARYIENFLGQPGISGGDLLDIGINQARGFGVEVLREKVTEVTKDEAEDEFTLSCDSGAHYRARSVIAASGVRDNIPDIENVYKFLGRGYYTCIDCDGYHTRGRKLLVMGNHINAVRLSLVMQRIFTPDVSLLLLMYDPPPDYVEELAEQGVTLYKGRPARILGDEAIEALELHDGTRIPCETIMQNFGYKLNDGYLKGLELERDAAGFKYVVDTTFRSSLDGLYIVGPLNTGNDQVVISAGAGATAAIAIKKKLLAF